MAAREATSSRCYAVRVDVAGILWIGIVIGEAQRARFVVPEPWAGEPFAVIPEGQDTPAMAEAWSRRGAFVFGHAASARSCSSTVLSGGWIRSLSSSGSGRGRKCRPVLPTQSGVDVTT